MAIFHYIVFSILHSLHCIYYNHSIQGIHYVSFITWHPSNCIAFIMLNSLHCIHYVAYITLDTRGGHYNKMAFDKFYSIFLASSQMCLILFFLVFRHFNDNYKGSIIKLKQICVQLCISNKICHFTLKQICDELTSLDPPGTL